jgi:microcompartment protein CcmK/EutM
VMRSGRQLPRELVTLAVGCPRCGAGAGEACLGVAGQARRRNHEERVEAAAAAIAAERDRRGLRRRR